MGLKEANEAKERNQEENIKTVHEYEHLKFEEHWFLHNAARVNLNLEPINKDQFYGQIYKNKPKK